MTNNSSESSSSETNQQADKDSKNSNVISKILFINTLVMFIGLGIITFKHDIAAQKDYNHYYNTECKPIVDNKSSDVDEYYVAEEINICEEITDNERNRHGMFIASMAMLPLFLIMLTMYYFKYKD